MSHSKLPDFMTRVQSPLPGVEERAREHRERVAAATLIKSAQQGSGHPEERTVEPSPRHQWVMDNVNYQIREFPPHGADLGTKIKMHLYALRIFTRRDEARATTISTTIDAARALVESGKPAEALAVLQAALPRPVATRD